MWRLGFETIPAYLLVMALITLLVAVIAWQRQRSGKTISVWFFSAVVGILLGSVGSYAVARLSGYTIEKEPRVAAQGPQPLALPGGEEEEEEGEEGEEGGGPAGGPRRGGPVGMFGPSPKRDLANLVRKLELLTGDIGIELDSEQAASVLAELAGIEKAETMSDEQAQAKQEAILAVLTDEQKAQLDAIGLPRSFRRGGGGQRPSPDANPFHQEAAAKALSSLRERFGGIREPEPPEPPAGPKPKQPAAAEQPEQEATPAETAPSAEGQKPAEKAAEAEESGPAEEGEKPQ